MLYNMHDTDATEPLTSHGPCSFPIQETPSSQTISPTQVYTQLYVCPYPMVSFRVQEAENVTDAHRT